MRLPGKQITAFVISGIILAAPPVPGADIISTRHNLSASAPAENDYSTSEESRVCVFCHTPHFADPVEPLWNRNLSGETYQLYQSSTLTAAPGQPTGPSRLCLSCHDGTIALGDFGYKSLSLGPITDGDSSHLSSDLSDDHPISFAYTDDLALNDGELRPTSEISSAGIVLWKGELHCTACHDPHNNINGSFLVMDNSAGALCTTCHDKTGWLESGHYLQGVTCQDCHSPHNAAQGERLLASIPTEEVCFRCHDGTSAIDVASAFQNMHIHPVAEASSEGVHDPTESALSMDRHVECMDCHDPHQANTNPPAVESGISGFTKGISGIDLDGNEIDSATYEYEICFRCHSDKPVAAEAMVPRQVPDLDGLAEQDLPYNERHRFSPANPSYHPVTDVGASLNVPSLRPEYTAGSSRITCSDCHNTDNGTKAGGLGANGVHGSAWKGQMIADYWFEKAGSEGLSYQHTYTQSDYELCWRCHDPALLMPAASFHDSHVRTHQVPCFVCHDPHGVPGLSPDNTRLINFTTLYGITGSFDGAGCSVSCHSVNPQPLY